jgi:MerR family transcriptional regulator, light-induced transcriptional regulator
MRPIQATSRWSIAEVERDTGLGKDTLRVWERRYGFPVPERDANGQRVYTQAAVDRLRQIAVLLRVGHRPGRVVPLDDAQREALLGQPAPGGAPPADQAPGASAREDAPGPHRSYASDAIAATMAALKRRDGLALRRHLQQACTRLGLGDFVVEVLAPLTTAVGQGWMAGELRVADEHLFTEVSHGVLRQRLLALTDPDTGDHPADGAAPRVLLTTLPGEPHGLGLLMAEAMCTLAGATCVNLGPQTPLDEIVAATEWHQAQVVGLSATGALPVRALRQGLQQLRERLPASAVLWVGGAAAGGLRGLAGVVRMGDLRAIAPALAAVDAPKP